MSVSLTKGGNVSLSKTDPQLKKLLVGLGWKARETDGVNFDLDVMVFLVNEQGKIANGEKDFIYYNNLQNANGSVVHSGDNRTGDGDGDDETVTFDLANIPENVKRAIITVSIDNAEARRQTFGQVIDAYVRCVNDETKIEVARFDLSEDSSTETAMIFAEVYRHNNEWKFKAVQQGYKNGLKALVESFGLNVA